MTLRVLLRNLPPPDNLRFFLDKSIGAPGMAEVLRPAGWTCITHEEHFAGRYGVIEDPEIIQTCGIPHWFLITSDKDLPVRWIAEIRAAIIGIFLLSNQNDGSDLWAKRLISCELDIIDEATHRECPFVARVSTSGKLYLLNQIDAETFQWRRIYHRAAQ
jgi:hypothetical protein